MRQWLTLLLAVVVMASSVVPCCAMEDCDGGTIGCEDVDHPLEKKGACSPFFTCGSCSGFFHQVRTIQVEVLATSSVVHPHIHADLLPAAYRNSLFQPPRA